MAVDLFSTFDCFITSDISNAVIIPLPIPQKNCKKIISRTLLVIGVNNVVKIINSHVLQMTNLYENRSFNFGKRNAPYNDAANENAIVNPIIVSEESNFSKNIGINP